LKPFEISKTYPKRAQSIFSQIPIDRSCDDIGIPFHFCSCQLSWKKVSPTSLLNKQANQFVINYLNTLLKPTKGMCSELTLKESSNNKVEKTVVKLSRRILTIQFETLPNNGTFEAIIDYEQVFNDITEKALNEIIDEDLNSEETPSTKYEFKLSSTISRTNAYGNQSICLSKIKPGELDLGRADLRNYCYCV
jgi:hypothetical protein